MKTWILLVAGMSIALPTGVATHDQGCTPESQDPATYNQIVNPVTGEIFYILIDLNGPSVTVAKEANGVPGWQRGGVGLLGSCFPSEQLCLLIDEDPVNAENCGHGPDALII